MIRSSNSPDVEPITFILDPVDPREAQARLISALFSIALGAEPDAFQVSYDDTRERIYVRHCEHILTGRCSPVPHTWTMQIHSDDTGYRFWDTNARLIAFDPIA